MGIYELYQCLEFDSTALVAKGYGVAAGEQIKMTGRSRGPNESQKWYCSNCESVEFHEVTDGKLKNEDDPGKYEFHVALFDDEIMPVYRRRRKCVECNEPELFVWTVECEQSKLKSLIHAYQHCEIEKFRASEENQRISAENAALRAELQRIKSRLLELAGELDGTPSQP